MAETNDRPSNGRATVYQVYQALERLEDKVDIRLERIEDRLSARDDDHEARIRYLERWKYGIGASLVAALGALGSVIVALVRGVGS